MLSSELRYELPDELIAQGPSDRRDNSRLLVHNRKTGKTSHHRFHELPDLLPSGSRIFRNDVSVLKARIPGQRSSGGRVECLLLGPVVDLPHVWRCLLKPGGKTEKAGNFFLPNEYQAAILEKDDSGEYIVRFNLLKDDDVLSLAERLGSMPLPPYVRRPVGSEDDKRYQTVYADPQKRTAVAAPTAGLHFTADMLAELKRRAHRILDLTLSVGPGTFRPIETESIEGHQMHAEPYQLPPATQIALHESGPPRLAIGTTTVRAIEHYLKQGTAPQSNKTTLAEADLFIRPPYEFMGVDLLLTNFHLPGSTLLCLVASFLTPGKATGLALLKKLYAEAMARNYRFYSYGDAMLIL
ncbi:MAG: tRNA preQ1(34) S-adenosylmethionine ribosyltransferase-isomerase QueA [Opitutales bacterium]|jgi:S-adenosylmethionine:tRNA ribosyltransferase-isomerase